MFVQEYIDVLCLSRSSRGLSPLKIQWRNRVYPVTDVGFHYTKQEGRTLLHIYSLVSDQVAMKVSLNSETLKWRLEEIVDD